MCIYSIERVRQIDNLKVRNLDKLTSIPFGQRDTSMSAKTYPK